MLFHYANALGLFIGYLLDLILADPKRFHPVAGFGRIANALDRVVYRDSRFRGVIFTFMLVGCMSVLGYAVSFYSHQPIIRVVTVSLATWIVLGGTSLIREAKKMSELLTYNDLTTARFQLRSLCGRNATSLDDHALARATVESVAENTSDAVVAPLFWGALFGIPGLFVYRAINTLDAMVGHRSARYAKFGTASARLDDLVNLIPARISGVLAAILAPVVGGSMFRSVQILIRDGKNHPSPNAGQVEAAFAGALGVVLGGTNSYEGELDNRPELGHGRVVEIADIERAIRLSRAVQVGAVFCAVLVSTCLNDPANAVLFFP